MVRGFGWGVVLSAGVLGSISGLVACGSEQGAGGGGTGGSPSTGGTTNTGGSTSAGGSTSTGGSSNTGGGVTETGGAPGAGGGSGRPWDAILERPPETPMEICIAYSYTLAARQAECRGTPLTPDGHHFTEVCPDVLFSPGSTRTPEGVLACAEEWLTFPCEDVRAHKNPDCVTPGERPLGAPCRFFSQCETLQCTGSNLLCGVCEERPVNPPPSPRKPLGEACTSSWECDPTLYCDLAGGDTGLCSPRPGPEQPCAEGGYCDATAYCDPYDICRARREAGAPCGGSSGDGYCADGLWCDDRSGERLCRPEPMLGEECDPGRLALCPPASRCACADAACSTSTCQTVLLPGARCDAGQGVCVPGSECVAGTCEPVESQGLFDECEAP